MKTTNKASNVIFTNPKTQQQHYSLRKKKTPPSLLSTPSPLSPPSQHQKLIFFQMGATEHVVGERENEIEAGMREKEGDGGNKEERVRDLERGEVGVEEREVQSNHVDVDDDDNVGHGHDHEEFNVSRFHRLNPTNPLRIVINSSTRVAKPSQPTNQSQRSHTHTQSRSVPTPIETPQPPPQQPVTLNSRRYTNRISLFIFALHQLLAIALVCFLVFKGIRGLIQDSDSVKRKQKNVLKFFLPQVEVATFMSIILAFIWQGAIRKWPTFMIHFILWCTFIMSLAAGILLICFQKAPTDGVGVCFIAFAIGNGLYGCWVSHRIKFCCKVLSLSLQPVSKFSDLNKPTYNMLGVGFLWISLWILAVIGALNFYFPPLIIIVLVLSLMWTTEVMRNVVNITVSRVIALYYLRGMQSSTQFCLLRALTRNLGSACLGSLFVPAIEALRIVARGLNLLEGEDEFMFCCARCCLRVMDSIFRNGNSWAYVQIAAYGKGFVNASQDTWSLFEKEDMVPIVDADITSSICFLTGVCSGSICVIVVAAWTQRVHQSFTATLSLLTFLIGYLLTRIAMAVPHACVSCYYVCYAENPDNRLFDKTIKDRQALLKTGREVVVPTPRGLRRYTTRS
ncbi:protein PNS1 isoform X2 [Cicer arietinum]|uniref:Choline transporter-like protein n=1 Tax=Cicer arietinum TaxID=3827 RepID=A0A1S2Y622_CICAR|nr:protein PNS1 isoform X2 [Cicer arietinum]